MARTPSMPAPSGRAAPTPPRISTGRGSTAPSTPSGRSTPMAAPTPSRRPPSGRASVMPAPAATRSRPTPRGR